MDLGLPEVDGGEVTRRLKADPVTGRIPVIALTAHVLAEDRTRALAAGCADFDIKPVDLDRLLAKMSRVLAERPRRAIAAPTARPPYTGT